MPPKRGTSRGASSGASGRAVAKGKAKATAKSAAAAASQPDPAAEATEMFERYEPDGKLEGSLKLAQFANCIRDMNVKKMRIWGDDPAEVVKQEWKKVDGFSKRELSLEDFKAWWPSFRQLVEARCAEVEQERLEEEHRAEAAARAREEMCSGDGVWTVPLNELPFAMQKAREKGKTPLVIDNTENFRAEAYFVYRDTYIMECKKFIMDKATKKMSVEEILEEERQRFFRGKCFFHGKTVMFRLANSAADLKGTWNNEVFPTLALLDATQVSHVIESGDNFEKSAFLPMCPDSDTRLQGIANGVHKEFNVVAVTQFPLDDYEEFLKDALPLQLLQPVNVTIA